MSLKTVLAASATVACIAAPAHALALLNDDAVAYSLEVIEGEGDVSAKRHSVDPGQTLTGLCPAGCIISLSTGVDQVFSGDEVVTIKNGEFVIAE